MKITRAMRLLRAIKILQSLSGREANLTAGELGSWAGLPYSTSHRYMAWLLKLRLVQRHTTICRNQETYTFSLTKEGMELLSMQKDLI